MNRKSCAALLALAVVAGSPLNAGTPPDPAIVEVPAITEGRDPKVIEDGWKWFYFHRANTSYAQAYADIEDCYRFLPVPNAGGVSFPGFAPWRARADSKTVRPPPIGPYGLVGDIIGSIVAGPIERRARQSRMRRCMEPKGYQRYPMSEDNWKRAVNHYSPLTLPVQAKLAAGAAPNALPLAENK
jgi:hypothetical protein